MRGATAFILAARRKAQQREVQALISLDREWFHA